MDTLRQRGWFITEHGFDIISDRRKITDIQQLVKRATNHDFKEIGSGEGNINEGNIVLQVQKVRNISAPKNNEESGAAPRLLKLSLTDGKNNYQAVEFQHIPSLSLNTLPGTKIWLEKTNIPTAHGVILLQPNHIKKVLGGHVTNLVEKWELNKKLASHSRVRSVEEGGPPPWIPFGQEIVSIIDKTKGFKSLNSKVTPVKENTEFEAQRNDAIAEAAKKGNKKVFSGGSKQLLDHSVQKIVDQGFTIEQAEYALKMNRNNIGKALKSLGKFDSKPNREPKEPKPRRGEKRGEESGKPSSGKVSLFDFLEDKLPAQVESLTVNENAGSKFNRDYEPDRHQTHGRGHQSTRGGRTQRGGAHNQRRTESNNWPNYNANDSLYFNASSQPKPPRFQNQSENESSYQQDNTQTKNYKPSNTDYRSGYFDGGTNQAQFKNQAAGTARQNSGDFRSRGKGHDDFHGKRNGHQKGPPVNKGHRNQPKRNFSDDGYGDRNTYSNQRKDQLNRQETALATETWFWKKGDKCLAKYWEDNMYYQAEVSAISERTCVVRFADFGNFEEVLQVDCIPITEENHTNNSMSNYDMKIHDYQVGNRNPRNNYNHQANVTDALGGGETGRRGRSYKKRIQQRSAQPIYQPPAQRSFTLEQLISDKNKDIPFEGY